MGCFILPAMKALILGLAMLLVGLSSSEVAAAKPLLDLPKGLAMAKTQGKPIFAYVFDSI